MAEIHRTTLRPSKLELLTGWLPRQPWYRGPGPAPQLSRAGGFRLDDPAGEVGIEFLFVIAADAGRPGGATTYHVPLSYRGAPLAGAADGLLGTAEHGVLGRRWIYDGLYDPVVVAQLLALVAGAAPAQHQSISHTPDASVGRGCTLESPLSAAGGAPGFDAATGSTTLPVRPADSPAGSPPSALHVIRVPQAPAGPAPGAGPGAALGHVEADVPQGGGETLRCPVVLVR